LRTKVAFVSLLTIGTDFALETLHTLLTFLTSAINDSIHENSDTVCIDANLSPVNPRSPVMPLEP
jgi:hypothetical protein